MILLIDCSPAMQQPGENGDTSFANVIKLAASFVKDKIIHSRNDQIGVCLYNTRTSQNNSGFNGIHVYIPLDEPSANMIMQIEQLTDKGQQEGVFERDIGTGDGKSCQLSQSLWACSSMFAESNLKNSFKRIFLFTNNDDPCENDPDQAEKTRLKNEDLKGLEITLELFPMSRQEGPKFDVLKYWANIIEVDEDESGRSHALHILCNNPNKPTNSSNISV